MGFLDTLLGRTRPAKPNLDVLFGVASASYTLEASLGYAPSGTGAVCFKRPEGMAAGQAEREIGDLLTLDPSGRAEASEDEYGFTWIVVRRDDHDLSALVTDLHAVNSTLDSAGFGAALLCTVVGFASSARGGVVEAAPLMLVYLYKRGTFYPFVPTGPSTRDTTMELEVRAHLAHELPIESDLSRWFPLWNAPVH
jgi:hypothetical protein